MSDHAIEPCPFSGHAVIAGFGVPGRAAAEWFADRHMKYCVIELNRTTVDRCNHLGMHMIEGDARGETTLLRAGIDRAVVFVIAMPNDAAVLDAVRAARALNPTLRILARCHYTSAGMEAHRRGANEVVVEEQVVGQEFSRMLSKTPMPEVHEPNGNEVIDLARQGIGRGLKPA